MSIKAKNDAVTDEQIIEAYKNDKTLTVNGAQTRFGIGYGRAKRLNMAATGAPTIEQVIAKPENIIEIEVVNDALAIPASIPAANTVTDIVPLKAQMATPIEDNLAPEDKKVVAELKQKHAAQKVQRSKDGEKALVEVEKIIAANATLESQLEHSYVRLGTLLLVVSQGEYYRSVEVEDPDTGEKVPCRSMGLYLECLAEKYNKGKRMLQYYLSTVKTLSPSVSGDNLNTMGIQKARALADITRMTDIQPDGETVKQVIGAPNVEAVKQLLFDKYHVKKTETPKGTWYPLEGFYVEDDDRALLDEAFKKAARIIKPTANMPDWMVRRESLKLMAAEFLNVPEKSQA
jgi:hypothetical protein